MDVHLYVFDLDLEMLLILIKIYKRKSAKIVINFSFHANFLFVPEVQGVSILM